MDYKEGYVYELMENGGPTDVREPYFKEAVDEMMRARTLCAKANACMPDDPAYVNYLEELFGRKLDDVRILTPFICDFGNRVKFGKGVFINHSAILSASGGIEFEDGSMADNYEVTKKEGTLKVTPATLKIKTPSKTKAYDGKALTAEGSISGLADGETVTFKTTGSQTKVGSSENTYELTWDGTAKESNYTVQEDLGKLTVTAAKEPDKKKDNNKKSKGVATGDNTALLAGGLALMISALGLCGAFLVGRRKKEEN